MNIALLLSVTVLLSPSVALGELPELLTPATPGSGLASAKAKNDYYLKKNTYFAKRYRIVEVNTELLTSAERLKVSLFDDAYIVAEVTSLDIRHDGASIWWTGKVVEPTLSLEDVIREGLTADEAEVVHAALVGLKITAAEISFDEATGTKYQYDSPRFSRFRGSSSKNASDGNSSRSEQSGLYDVVMTIKGVTGFQYELRPLELDPRYHLLVEIDPDKIFSKGPLDDPDSLEQVPKRQEYDEFLRSLGPDPRDLRPHPGN